MEINTELINENELSNMITFYNNIQNNFENSILINPQFENEIEKIYNRSLLNLSKLALNLFNLKYIEMFEELADYHKNNSEMFDFSKSLIKIINSYFEELNDNLNIKNQEDFDELKYILEISLILMEGVIEDKDIELAYETFFQIERRIEKYKLYDDSITVVKEGDFELKFTITDESNSKNLQSDDIYPFELITDNVGI
ncbi:hypothetical protein [uncultured Methanobrevibacter sp.]|uniref:hypothetical protein n=1 Tax=uncultured Methanobrevibacter sp. TaxID=253161 RepID=UPI00260189E1|nr:hypothetical protein [uncultured Methanobrevibacter sp.]